MHHQCLDSVACSHLPAYQLGAGYIDQTRPPRSVVAAGITLPLLHSLHAMSMPLAVKPAAVLLPYAVEGRVGAPPVANDDKGNLTFSRVNTYPYTSAPIPAWADPETYGELLANPDNCTMWTNRTGDRLTIFNCSKCGWKLAQDWPDAQRMPYLYSSAGTTGRRCTVRLG